MIDLHKSDAVKLAQVHIDDLKSYVKNYQTHVSKQNGQSPDDVVVATTIPHEVLKQLLADSNSNAVRIYMGKMNGTDDMTFMATAATKNSLGVTTDSIADGNGLVFMLDPCPSNACPDGADFVKNSSLVS